MHLLEISVVRLAHEREELLPERQEKAAAVEKPTRSTACTRLSKNDKMKRTSTSGERQFERKEETNKDLRWK